MSVKLYERQIVWRQYVSRRIEEQGRRIVAAECRPVDRSGTGRGRRAQPLRSNSRIRHGVRGSPREAGGVPSQRRRGVRTTAHSSPLPSPTTNRRRSKASAGAGSRGKGFIAPAPAPAPSYSGMLAARTKLARWRVGSCSPAKTKAKTKALKRINSAHPINRARSSGHDPAACARDTTVATQLSVGERTSATRSTDSRAEDGHTLDGSKTTAASLPTSPSSVGHSRQKELSIRETDGGGGDGTARGGAAKHVSSANPRPRGGTTGRGKNSTCPVNRQMTAKTKRSTKALPESSFTALAVAKAAAGSDGGGSGLGKDNGGNAATTCSTQSKRASKRGGVVGSKKAAGGDEGVGGRPSTTTSSHVHQAGGGAQHGGGPLSPGRISDLTADGTEEYSPYHKDRDCGGGAGGGCRGTTSACTASPGFVGNSSPAYVTELAQKEQAWSRERSQLLTVIKLQHKQLLGSSTGSSASSYCRKMDASSVANNTTTIAIMCESCRRSGATCARPSPLQSPLPPPPPPLPPPPPPLSSAESLGAIDAAPRTLMASDSTTLGGEADTWSLPDDHRTIACADDRGQDGSVFSTSERTQLFCTVERQRGEVKAAAAAAAAAARGSLLKGDDDGGDTTEKIVTRRVTATAQQAAAAAPLFATTVSQEPGVSLSGRRSGGGGGGAGLCQGNCGTAPRPGPSATGVPESGKDIRIAAAMETTRLESCPLARVDVEGRLQVLEGHLAAVVRRFAALEVEKACGNQL